MKMKYINVIFLLLNLFSFTCLKNLKSKTDIKTKISPTDKQKLQVYEKCTQPNTIALTFDDGPENTTEQHIDYFTKRNIKVTFFFVAKHLLDPEKLRTVQKAFNAGHDVGNHTFDHPSLLKTFKSNTRIEDVKKQLIYSSELFKEGLGVVPRYFRPPFGDIDKPVNSLLLKLGFKVFLWNLDTKDWSLDARDVVDKLAIVNKFRDAFNDHPEEREYISLQHEKSNNPEADLERINHIVELILSKGFKIVTMSECIGDSVGAYRDDVPNENLVEGFFLINDIPIENVENK
jgi:peptidoglycan/xylan/chitin deacetylase (PgdA/CDA1 family)